MLVTVAAALPEVAPGRPVRLLIPPGATSYVIGLLLAIDPAAQIVSVGQLGVTLTIFPSRIETVARLRSATWIAAIGAARAGCS